MYATLHFETVASLSHHAVQWDVSWEPSQIALRADQDLRASQASKNLPPWMWLKRIPHCYLDGKGLVQVFGKYCILLDTVPVKAWKNLLTGLKCTTFLLYKDCSGFTSTSTKILQSSLQRSKPETPKEFQSMANGSKNGDSPNWSKSAILDVASRILLHGFHLASMRTARRQRSV